MPSKRRKYNARFPAGRIKKIMQTDEQVGKVAQAVPIIISRTLELFVQSLLKSALAVTNARNARTLTTSHMKQCIVSDSRFHFLKDLVESLPDMYLEVNSFDDYPMPSASGTNSAPDEALSSFSGKRYRNSSQSVKSKVVPEERTTEDKDTSDSDSSASDKDDALTVEESTSDFVIDEDYGT